jgi:hypothetical protein
VERRLAAIRIERKFPRIAPEPIMDKTKIRVFADKVYADMAGAMTVGMAYLGVKRGLFRAMAGKGPMGAADVVQASGLHPDMSRSGSKE